MAKEKKCPECGRIFTCRHYKDCWCMEYELTQETLMLLKQMYPDCLCPECLGTFAEKKQ